MTKYDALKLLNRFSPKCRLIYKSDGLNTQAIIHTTKDRPWVNTGYTDPITMWIRPGESRESFWINVIHQIETSTGIEQ